MEPTLPRPPDVDNAIKLINEGTASATRKGLVLIAQLLESGAASLASSQRPQAMRSALLDWLGFETGFDDLESFHAELHRGWEDHEDWGDFPLAENRWLAAGLLGHLLRWETPWLVETGPASIFLYLAVIHGLSRREIAGVHEGLAPVCETEPVHRLCLSVDVEAGDFLCVNEAEYASRFSVAGVEPWFNPDPFLGVLAPELVHLEVQGFQGMPSLQNMTGLETLVVEWGESTSEFDLDASPATELRSLTLFHCPVTCVDTVVDLPRLTTLCVHGGLLRELPEDIGRLSFLKTLSLSGNMLEGLPESLARLSLESLKLAEESGLDETTRAWVRSQFATGVHDLGK